MGNDISWRPIFLGTVLSAVAVTQMVGTSLRASTTQPLQTLESSLYGRAQNLLRVAIPNNQMIATRDLADAALAILAAGGDPAQAEQLLNVVFSIQNMNVSSLWGAFPGIIIPRL
jgi:hypothetical protein